MRVGGVVLCGGQSRRMGRPKATLPFGNEVMLTRVLRLLGDVVSPLVVVAAPMQLLPKLPEQVMLARDRSEGRGPLEGLYSGLLAVSTLVEAAYVTACDVPLLQHDFVRYMIEHLKDADVAVPTDGTFYHPLSAVYRTSIVNVIGDCVAEERLKVTGFYDQVQVNSVPLHQLRTVDADLESLMNVNNPADYHLALQRANLSQKSTD